MKKKKETTYKNKGLYDGLDKKGMVIKGFAQASNNVMKELCINYHPNVGIVYFMLISHRHTDKDDKKYNQCFPTKELLGKETGLSEDTVDKCIKTLKDNDYILYRKGNSQYANQYFFPLEEFYKGEGDYLLKDIEDEMVDNDTEDIPAEDNEIVEEVPTNDDNSFPFLSGSLLEDKKEFTPKGKYIDDDKDLDMFDEIIPPIEDNSVVYVNEFYANMNKCYNINDETLTTNKAIIKRVNSLVGYVEEELVKNDIDDNAEKIIIDIMKSYKKSFGNSLNDNSIVKDFNKYTYIISCIQNTFKNKKLKALLKHTKVDLPLADDDFVNYMNDTVADDNFIELSNGERESKKEIIRRMEFITKNPKIKDDANKIASNIFKFYNYAFTDWNSCHINIIRDIVKGLEDNLGKEILISGFDGIEVPDMAI